MGATADTRLATALRAVGLPAELVGALEITGERRTPEPRLPVEEVGLACIGAALLAGSRLHEVRTGDRLPAALDRRHVRAALVSERAFRVVGEAPVPGFAPQSRFWQTADGWVRTHANFPWHHRALLQALGAATDDALAAAIAALPAAEIEEAVFAAGGVAAAVRTPEEWRRHPQGAAVGAEPLVHRVHLPGAAPRLAPPPANPSPHGSLRSAGGDRERRGPHAPAPAAGVRVLDFTRVIAGPVCSRYLGALGADVLRLDPPRLPDLEPGAAADTLLGKRSAFLDLRTAAGARHLEDLLAEADVVLLGYRPGSLARFGLAPEELAARHPGLVVMELAAWGHSGPWSGRRGFDSIVQAASGIAAVEAGPDGEPGALPCQLLDHGTGYLAAAAVLAALAEQREGGGSHLRRLSLARTARWLVDRGEPGPGPRERGVAAEPPGSTAAARPGWEDDGAALVVAVGSGRSLAAVPPPGSLGGAPLRWPGPVSRYGTADPAWDPA